MDSDENITQFLAFTGSSDTDTARSYLEMSGGSVETAVGLWLEHNGGGGGGGGGGAMGGGGAAAAAAAAGAGGGSFHGADAVRAPDRTRTEALIGPSGGHGAMAAAMAAGGMFAPGTMSGAEAAMMSAFAAASDDDDYDDDDHMEYVGGGEGSGSGSRSGSVSAAAFDAREAVNEAAAAAAAAGSSGGGGGYDGNANAGGDSTSTSNGGGTVGAAAAAAGGRATSLADMFAPPANLIYAGPGGFQGARQAARDSRRWLLVNIQSDSDFACHALNRDVWRDELVENLVRDGFIFWQAVDTTSEGSTYSERYRVGGYPHVAIIDPRTARLMWKKEGWTQVNPMTPVQFAETAADFCSRHSFDKPPSAPRSGSAAAAGPASGGRPSNKRPMADMSEEEQLEAAIRASMAEGAGGGGGSGSNDDEDSVIYADEDDDDDDDDNDGDDGDANVLDAENQKRPAAAADDDDEALSDTFEQKLLDQDIGEEPASGDDIARIQIRMPDGKRLVRKFRGEDSVRVIYAFVAQQSSDAVREGKQLELKAGFPPRDLLDRIDESIFSCGLAGEAITARCK